MQDLPSWAFIVWSVFVSGFTGVALASDLKTRRIPNHLTVPAFAAAFVFHTSVAGWAGLKLAAGGFAVGFGILFVLWLIGGGGGGDVKLMGALGAWLGTAGTMIVFVGSVAVAILMTIILLVARRVSPVRFAYATARASHETTETLARRSGRTLVPFAVPVGIATWLYVALRIVVWCQ